MNGRVDTLLSRQEDRNEGPTPQNSPGSEIEREVLELLRDQAGYPPSWKEVWSSLLPFYTELQIQNALLSLLDEGRVDMVYTSGHELDLVLSPSHR